MILIMIVLGIKYLFRFDLLTYYHEIEHIVIEILAF